MKRVLSSIIVYSSIIALFTTPVLANVQSNIPLEVQSAVASGVQSAVASGVQSAVASGTSTGSSIKTGNPPSSNIGVASSILSQPPEVKFNTSEIPSGYYTFTGSSQLTYSDGTVENTLFNSILSAEQGTIVNDVEIDAKNNYSDTTIPVSIQEINQSTNKASGVNYWGFSLSMLLDSLYNNESPTYLQLISGNNKFKIFIPQGRELNYQINQPIIAYAVSAIQAYVSAIQEGVLAGSMGSSYNVYSIYPNSEVPLSHVLYKNKNTGAVSIDGEKYGVSLNYSLLDFYNPIFGEMPVSSLVFGSKANSFWKSQISSVQLKTAGDSLRFVVNTSYSYFESNLESSNNTYIPISRSALSSLLGVKWYKTEYSSSIVKPLSLVNGTFDLAVPYLFVKSLDSTTYSIAPSGGYKLVDYNGGDISLQIANNYVYSNVNNTYTKLGSYAQFGIDSSSLVFIPLKGSALSSSSSSSSSRSYQSLTGADSSTGNTSIPNKATVGVVVPLQYGEGIVQFDGSTTSSNVSMTGRVINLGENYSGNIEFSSSNSNLLSATDPVDGAVGVPIQNYAFPSVGNYLDASSNTSLGTSPADFSLQIALEDKGSMIGFYMFMNTLYSGDSTLENWLQSSTAKAELGTNATTLYDYITGVYAINSKSLSYSQWQRMQQIKEELSSKPEMELQGSIDTIIIVGGILIIIYFIMLVLLYWIDIFSMLGDFSLLSLATLGRLYPTDNKEYAVSMAVGTEKTKYVNYIDILAIAGIGVLFGVILLNVTPVVSLVSNIYFTINSWVGGI